MSSSFMNLSSFIIMTFTGYKIENSKAKYHTFCSKKWCKKILKLVWHMPTNKYWDFPLDKVHNAQTNLRAQYITLSHLSSTLTQLWVISRARCFLFPHFQEPDLSKNTNSQSQTKLTFCLAACSDIRHQDSVIIYVWYLFAAHSYIQQRPTLCLIHFHKNT